MKIAIITDQHFGARKNSKLFHDYFLKFYNDIFFPTLEKKGITTVIDMGDTFDNRTGVNFGALSWAKNNYYDRLQQMGVKVHTIVGNHTAFYKNTNSINDTFGVGTLIAVPSNFPFKLGKTKLIALAAPVEAGIILTKELLPPL